MHEKWQSNYDAYMLVGSSIDSQMGRHVYLVFSST